MTLLPGAPLSSCPTRAGASAEVKRCVLSFTSCALHRESLLLRTCWPALQASGGGNLSLRIGIVGIGYGQQVLLPAFREDARCKVVAIAATTEQRARVVADRGSVPIALGRWQDLVGHNEVDAVAIAVAPVLQPDVACAAAQAGKPIFCEKPLAASLVGAERIATAVQQSQVPNMVDFLFAEIPAWVTARTMLANGELGRVRLVAVDWSVETYSNRARIDTWKARSDMGGGTLSSFCSHSLYCLEWLAGPVARVSAHLFRAPDDPRKGDTAVTMWLDLADGSGASVRVNTAAGPMRRHRIEVFAERGVLVLENTEEDYVSGFKLWRADPGDQTLRRVPDRTTWKASTDGRIMAAGAIVHRFLDWVLDGTASRPAVEDGLRVQRLLDAAQRSDRTASSVVLNSAPA